MITKDMSDDDVLDAILEEFEEDGRLAMNYLDIEVSDGSVTLSGRVSSEEELQIVEDVMEGTLKLTDYNNKIWVDETLSYEDPEDSGPDLRGLGIEDDEIDDQDYANEEEDDFA